MHRSAAVLALVVGAVVLCKVVDGSGHFVIFQAEIVVAEAVGLLQGGGGIFNNVLMFLKVEHGEVALVADALDVHGRLAEEVDDALASLVGVAV